MARPSLSGDGHWRRKAPTSGRRLREYRAAVRGRELPLGAKGPWQRPAGPRTELHARYMRCGKRGSTAVGDSVVPGVRDPMAAHDVTSTFPGRSPFGEFRSSRKLS